MIFLNFPQRKDRIRIGFKITCSLLLLLVPFSVCIAFRVSPTISKVPNRCTLFQDQYSNTKFNTRQFLHHQHQQDEGTIQETKDLKGVEVFNRSPTTINRRHVLASCTLLASTLLPKQSASAAAILSSNDKNVATQFSKEKIVSNDNNIDCLLDLPPLDTTQYVRIYLCRHGETNNNKYKIIQGSRIDAPINETGQQQAELLGRALARAKVQPSSIFHTPLIRTKQTAQYAASQFQSIQPLESVSSLSSTTTNVPTLKLLPSLRELDFGDVAEGAPVEEMRGKMIATDRKSVV